MTWYAIYETATGRLESIGERDEPLRTARLDSLALEQQPNLSQIMWDETTRGFVPRPAKVLVDRLDDFLTHPNYADFQTLWNALNATNKTRLRNIAIRLLGRNRYRNANQSVEIDE